MHVQYVSGFVYAGVYTVYVRVTCVYVCVTVCVYIYIYIYVCVCVCVCCVHVCVCMCVCVNQYLHVTHSNKPSGWRFGSSGTSGSI